VITWKAHPAHLFFGVNRSTVWSDHAKRDSLQTFIAKQTDKLRRQQMINWLFIAHVSLIHCVFYCMHTWVWWDL